MTTLKTKDCLTRTRLLEYLRQNTTLTETDIEDVEEYVCEILDDKLFEVTIKHQEEVEKAVWDDRRRIMARIDALPEGQSFTITDLEWIIADRKSTKEPVIKRTPTTPDKTTEV